MDRHTFDFMTKSQGIVFIPVSLLAGCISGCFYSCGNNQQSVDDDFTQIDSLKKEIAVRDSSMLVITAYIQNLSDCMDSIAVMQSEIGNEFDAETGRRLPAHKLKQREANAKERIAEYRQRIDSLNSAFGEQPLFATVAQLKNIVSFTDYEIGLVLANSETGHEAPTIIVRSRPEPSAPTSQPKPTETVKQPKQQEQKTVTAAAAVSEGYVRIGSKKELSKDGFITTGLFKKQKLNTESFDAAKMMAVDTRTFTDITLNSKKPKILTDMPNGSYELVSDGGNTTQLRITNPTKFWSKSKYLIIQL